MAKKEHTILIALICQVCKTQNYITKKNKTENKEKLILKKFCKRCRKHTQHKETEKLD
ncbi:50S ribosomal protein L33 [Candidatus Gottesmanbacteria bacterium RIFCSPHIGHO2_02_FULL_40_24]|uniref:Large ribosomal subunit protein bL33 n=1 Tax=Candidatus Gottesmanbacteria bacterium RIFCSPHIGHO2_01_FULL_40_15 TaxID=1798376 RepID=A0A1F5Z1K4_9BACT|nr:MAG: 50S ribosomal protein L33 [Candidatus Gottesmanbacteria bacterium RIFCSPHIGHO2_01_FULL_40_15]OGG17126.1 MAG: 50S ribosomal protein L33 [Candidatus Gottesmanbacteria bacterium RIFCSPHIGHO2_02_FULL_40_24]OGG21983.1 MAG: 50S ribosomal protein L33 [Candidatus Gottesmanbacteria bacterium RIFCSPLOWO2_01_FULL_40_10]OGG23173.1 MAG: 50S ribosomal protein L33 [Candidatus Gottesmanbacteria bacterium RIFCSPHIGHO2_12_FULL_40_13]